MKQGSLRLHRWIAIAPADGDHALMICNLNNGSTFMTNRTLAAIVREISARTPTMPELTASYAAKCDVSSAEVEREVSRAVETLRSRAFLE